MNFRIRHSLVLTALLSLSGFAIAQTPAPEPSSNKVDEKITITGTRTTGERFQLMRDFVTNVGRLASPEFGLARLEHGACIRVQGTSSAVADFLVKRLVVTAQQVGLATQKPGCKPNIDIVFSDNGKNVAAELVQKSPRVFKPFGNSEGTTKGDHALSEFVNSSQPVRWWQITVPVDRNGMPVVESANPEEPAYVVSSNSLISTGTREGLLGSLIIVDTGKLGMASWDQLADYLSFIALAEVDPKANVGSVDSILNLFGGSNTPAPGLSAWDKAYLHGLYSMNLYLRPRVQRAELAGRIEQELEK
ncbi:MAG TPA: hypothetical protein VMH83_02055 [Candidatus Acidoferrum sp.]|nr:hypothetical protein [Candidatus Acidoferrum sp.]